MKAGSLTFGEGMLTLHQWSNQVHHPINSTRPGENRRWVTNECVIGWLCDFLLGKLKDHDCFSICHHGAQMTVYKLDGRLWFRASWRGYRVTRQRSDFDRYARRLTVRALPDENYVPIDPAVFVRKMKETGDPLVVLRAIKKTQQNRRVRDSAEYENLYRQLYHHRYPSKP